MDRNDVIKLGFKELPHFTIGNDLVYDLGRNRHLSISALGTFNEMMFVGEFNKKTKRYSDLVCLHNCDYDGFLNMDKLKSLLCGILGKDYDKT